MILAMHARDDDMAALHVTHVFVRRHRVERVADDLDPRACDIGDRARRHLDRRTAGRRERRAPEAAFPLRADQLRAHANVGAKGARRHFVGDHEPRIVDARVGIDEPLAEIMLQSGAPFRCLQVDGERTRERHATREVVVHEKADAQHPRRAQVRLVRQHELQGLHEVRRLMQDHLALRQRLVDQPEFEVLEVAQSTVDQLGAPLRGGGGNVVLLDDQHPEAAAGSVAGDSRAIDAGADDDEIIDVRVVVRHRQTS